MKHLAVVGASLLALAACQSTADQPAAENAAWNKTYGGVDKSYDTQLLQLRERVAPTFQVLTFKDPENGVEMAYNLFVPEGYNPNDKSKRYPLVMFIADASTAGKGVKAPLMQGYGGIIWASDAVQRKEPVFVLVPSFKQTAVNDQHQTTPEVATALRLFKATAQNYRIDLKRLYTTGQSMGGMISFYLNSIEPDLFTASMFVGSQWDVNVLKPLAKAKFIYTVSAADPKASAGMNEVGQMLKNSGVCYGETEFSAKLPQSEQDAKVAALLKQGHRINFIRFTPNTVIPEGYSGKGGEHMYSFDYAYLLAPARDWLLAQRK